MSNSAAVYQFEVRLHRLNIKYLWFEAFESKLEHHKIVVFAEF